MLFLRNVTFMTAEPRALADFWQAALALPERRDDEGETIVADADWSFPRLTFQKVTESERRGRQLHLDLTATDRVTEVARLRALGASEAGSVKMTNGWTWTVMTDPDGNEFCVTDP